MHHDLLTVSGSLLTGYETFAIRGLLRREERSGGDAGQSKASVSLNASNRYAAVQ